MNYSVSTFPCFDREAKKLAKRYKSFKRDLLEFVNYLLSHPEAGVPLGHNLRKVRMSIADKGKGKSGGARVITYTVIVSKMEADIKLLTIYDKSDRETISDAELMSLMKSNGLV